MAIDWDIRTRTPAFLRLANLETCAVALEALAPIDSQDLLNDARYACEEAMRQGAAAWDAAWAAAAWDAAWDAVAAAGAAARDAARDAAPAAAGDGHGTPQGPGTPQGTPQGPPRRGRRRGRRRTGRRRGRRMGRRMGRRTISTRTYRCCHAGFGGRPDQAHVRSMTGRLPESKLAEIAERAGKATPGPWTHIPCTILVDFPDPDDTDWTPEDAAFVAEARQDIPALLEHVRALEAEHAAYKASSESIIEDRRRQARDWRTERAAARARIAELTRLSAALCKAINDDEEHEIDLATVWAVVRLAAGHISGAGGVMCPSWISKLRWWVPCGWRLTRGWPWWRRVRYVARTWQSLVR